MLFTFKRKPLVYALTGLFSVLVGTVVVPPPVMAAASNPQAGETLANYLRRNALLPGVVNGQTTYLPGLVLKRAEQVPAQNLQRTQLLTELFSAFGSANNSYSELVQRLPATGRLPLKSVDADFLTLNPQLNPRLQPGDEVIIEAAPGTVLVLGDSAYCQVPYSPGVEALAYAKACDAKRLDTVWLVQPTGQVHKLNVGLWNAEIQVVPMPGAWILAPNRGSAITAELAQQLADFLSTQGPAHLPTQFEVAQWVKPASQEVFESRSVDKPLRDLPVSSSTWGWVGLLQTPTARMRPAGTASVTASRVEPYSRYSIILQPFDWLEGGFRYNKITNRDAGPFDFTGDQKFLDKNIDVKLRILTESVWLPSVAVGLQDIGGTSLFAGEYLVTSKRFGSFDTSLGLGWGYLGNSGDITNPLGIITDEFKDRPAVDFGQGGELSANTYFRGRASIFGGVQWQTPWNDLVLKLEYEGNNYQNEPLDNPQVQRSRFNYGVVYRLSDSANFHLGIERGNTLSVGISLFENFSTFNTPKVSDPKPLLVDTSPKPEQADWQQTLRQMQQQTNWEVVEVNRRGSEVQLDVRNGEAAYYNQSVERAAEVLHQNLPEDIKWFTLNYENNGNSVGQHVVDRDKFVQRRTEYGVETQQPYPEQVAIEGYNMPYEQVYQQPYKRFSSEFSIGYQQVLGGADGFLYQLSLANDTRLNITQNTWVEGRAAYRLIDNFDKFKQIGNSRLPPVRTNLREYAVTSDFTIPDLAIKHMGKLANNHFYGVYGGLLEQMFAGVGAEYLYRPFNSWYAIGVDVNKVRQREFEQDFGLQSYEVNTGHITAYVDTGFEDILATISVGQYLAGDKGVTVDVSREFNNGVRMGAFATRTNVSAEDFGEGSFDKGIYMTVPFSAFFTKSIPGDANFLWRPLTRDGGAKLNRGFSLYQQTEIRNHKTLKYTPE